MLVYPLLIQWSHVLCTHFKNRFVIVCSEKQFCAGNKGDITFMCRPAMLQMMKHGNEAIGSKVNFALENCLIGIEAASID